MPRDDDEYQVGYGKPPKQNQFKKGASGNPHGRPRGAMNISTKFRSIMLEKISVTENGRQKTITRLEAVSRQMINKALSGDMRAIGEVMRWTMMFDQGGATVLGAAEQKQRDDKLVSAFLRDLEENNASFDTKDDKAKLQEEKNGKPINVFYDDDEE